LAALIGKLFIYLTAEKIMEKLLKGIENLHYIDRAQLEFFILKHCDFIYLFI